MSFFRTLVPALVLMLAVNASARDVTQYTIEQFMNTTAISGASFSPNGDKILVTSDQTGIPNAFAIPVDGSEPVQLTHSTTNTIYARSYFPHDERIIYVSDNGGDERNKVYIREVDGSVSTVTPEDGVKADFFGWAQDDQSFFVTSNARDPKYFDIIEVDAKTYKTSLFYENETGYNVSAISRDKKYLALSKTDTRANVPAFLYDRSRGELTELFPWDGDAVRSPQAFKADGSGLYMLVDMASEYRFLVENDLHNDMTALVSPDWDVMYARLSKTGKYLTVGINNDSRSEVKIRETETKIPLRLPDMGSLDIASVTFSNDEKAIAFYVQGGQTPGDLYYYHLSGSHSPRRLTNRLNPEIDTNDLVVPEVVRFASYDDTMIPGILYKPHQASASNKVPALVYVHGGPGGQTRASWNPLIQYLVNHGYAVYGINNRGSSGYGKTFYAMDDLKHGDADLDDCVASKQMLADTGYVDPDKIGIIGGSYGGYMVCAALAFRPEEFDVGVNIFGVTNWVRTLKSIPSWWESTRNALYKELGDPFTQEEYLTKISPLFHASNIRKPMIVLQGANDPRVLQVESDEMVAAVRANEVPVDYVVFDDEGHGFRKKENQITGYKAVMDFLEKHFPATAQ